MLSGPGTRCYVLIAGGLTEPEYLGSTATFTMAMFGGHQGRALRAGDTLTAGADPGPHAERPHRDARAAIDEQPAIGHRWEVAVTEGPHGAPEFFTRADMDTIVGTDYTVHFNSDRTGVRLDGPRPQWARTDGGEAGLHPSNIHDNAYCVGALDFTGDTPILLGPDGPSLGGFVCPVTVVRADRWKLGQMAPGDTVRFVPVRADRAAALDPKAAHRACSYGRCFEGNSAASAFFTDPRRAAFELPSTLAVQMYNKRGWPEFLISRGRLDEALVAATALIGHPVSLIKATGHIEAGQVHLEAGRFAQAAEQANQDADEQHARPSPTEELREGLTEVRAKRGSQH